MECEDSCFDAPRHPAAPWLTRGGDTTYASGVANTIDGETAMFLIREALEGLVEPRAAQSVIFQALDREGVEKLPSRGDDLIAFIEGPLREATAERVGASSAREVVERLSDVLGHAIRRPDTPGNSRTVEVPAGAGPVRVLVMGRSTSLAVRLRAALGGDRVAVGASTALPAAEHMIGSFCPELVILDAVDPLQDDVHAVARLVGSLPGGTTRLIWGREQPWAEKMSAALDGAGVIYTPVDRRDGVDPLLDLIRSRPRSAIGA